MNLVASVTLHAGGPGSGRHPEGRSVRWRPGYVSKYLKSKFVDVSVANVRRNPTNGRLNNAVVKKYLEMMRLGKTLVSPQGYKIGNDKYELNDGHHRFAAAQKFGAKTIKLQVVQ